ncbi:hypothetical protein AB205_0177090, partial [Aquarana catesbeiana]
MEKREKSRDFKSLDHWSGCEGADSSATPKNEVNAIKWDPSGMLLASCSDDMTL